MTKKFIALLTILIGIYLPSVLYGQELLNIEKVNRQPYFKFELKDSPTDTLTFYLSEFNRDTTLPLIVYVQGSGHASLFSKHSDSSIRPRSGHIHFAYESKDIAKVLIVEKPGIQFLESKKINKDFDQRFSLESWSDTIVKAINYIIQHENIDTSRIMVAGHSEGGVVAARVSGTLKDLVSHTAIIAGNGPTQLYSLYLLAEEGVFFDQPGFNKEQRIDSLLTAWDNIRQQPEATDNKFWGFTYKRWSSFLSTSVYDELKNFDGAIRIVQGTDDKNVAPETAKILYTSLLSIGKDVIYSEIKGADHSFNIKEQPGRNGWKEMIKGNINWFLENK